jgi:hypothetical protein
VLVSGILWMKIKLNSYINNGNWVERSFKAEILHFKLPEIRIFPWQFDFKVSALKQPDKFTQ